jgi:hemoglobin-like flavoprotein
VPDGAAVARAGGRTDRRHADAIESSLEIAGERGGDLTARVYAVLFAREPQLYTLFSRDADDAIKGEMLAKVVEAILDFVSERRYADYLIEAEAANHEAYEVPRAAFAAFFRIVADVVQDACGADWTRAMDAAWSETLADLDAYVANRLCEVAGS